MSIDITVGAEAIYKAMSEVEVEPDEIFLLETKRTTSEPKFIRVEIHDFAKKMKDEKFKKEAILTPTFDIVGKKLAISVQPEEKNSEGIAVYLMNQNKEEITASCTIDGVVTQRSFEKKELSAGSGLGFSCFVTHEDFKKWAVRHDDLKLDVRVTLHFSDNVSGWTIKGKPKIEFDPLEMAMADINIRDDKTLTDFTVVSQDGGRFPCHRIFLATQSPVMMAMMTHNMKEKQENELRLEYKEDVVKNFVDYFYTGKVSKTVLEENLESFLALSECYDLTPLKYQAEEAAIEKISVENMVQLFALSLHYNAYKLMEVSEFKIKTNRASLKDQDLSGVPYSVVTTIFKILC